MKIAVASGKGGTGKTTVSTSLALSLVVQRSILFLDCDVEAPNAHIFLKPEIDKQQDVVIPIPSVDPSLCTACGRCAEVCAFHALAKVGRTILVFPQLCHGCGSCTWNCPVGAISEIPNSIGLLESGMTSDGICFAHGLLTISEPMPTPVIRQLKKLANPSPDAVVILDAPPGASCSVVETLREVDFVLLVTEPTPFGLHDLKQMMGIIQEMGIPAGIVINRDGIGDSRMVEFLVHKQLPILLRIPFDKTIAAGIASGKNLIELFPEYRSRLLALFHKISDQVYRGVIC